MSSPVQLSDLDLATVADDADLTLIRKDNTTDFKITVQAMRNIAVASLPNLPTPAQVNDYMLINQSGTNCKIEFGKVGFTQGTKMWFYSGAPPNVYWNTVPNTGDRLLAVKSASGAYQNSGNSTSLDLWQQKDTILTEAQIPAHTHTLTKTKATTGSSNNLGPCRGKHTEDDSNPAFRVCTTNATGGSQGHNHGNIWRPAASVGLICEKLI